METIMAQSRNYDELEYVWTQWRDVSGAQYRTNYANYVTLSNEAATLNGEGNLRAR